MWLVVLVSLLAVSSSASKINSQNYLNIDDGFKFCFKRLNATHSVGCSSSVSGNVGIVYLMMNETAAEKFKNVADSSYIVLMSMKIFTDASRMEELNRDKRVKGVVVVEPQTPSDRPTSFSVDSQCPNADRSVYGPRTQCDGKIWNSNGTDYFFKSWNFPIVLLTAARNKSLTKILECYEKYNTGETDDERRCALEVKTAMSAVTNSRVCLRRNDLNTYFIQLSTFCDPMYGNNFHYVFGPQVENAERNTIIVTARLDAFSLFTDYGFGSLAVYPGVSMVVALAEAFSNLPSSQTPKKRIIFSLLDGESTQYMGSARLVYDMKQKTFLKAQLENATELRHIHSVIELGQLGNGALDGQFYVHTSSASRTAAIDEDWTKKLVKNANASGVNLQSQKTAVLPPSSVQSFLKGSDNISAVLISDYESSFRNSFYHSMFDDEKKIAASTLYKLTKAVFSSLYEEAFQALPTSNVDEQKFTEISACFYNVSACQLRMEASDKSLRLANNTLILDTTMRANRHGGPFAILTSQLLFYLTGQEYSSVTTAAACNAEKDKNFPKRSYRWVRGPDGNSSSGVCWRSLVATYSMKAPNINDWLAEWDTKTFAYWTESVWTEPRIRLFLAPSQRWETLVLCVGIILTIVTILLVILVNRYLENIFPGLHYASGTNST